MMIQNRVIKFKNKNLKFIFIESRLGFFNVNLCLFDNIYLILFRIFSKRRNLFDFEHLINNNLLIKIYKIKNMLFISNNRMILLQNKDLLSYR